jgi:hypothetical protein
MSRRFTAQLSRANPLAWNVWIAEGDRLITVVAVFYGAEDIDAESEAREYARWRNKRLAN